MRNDGGRARRCTVPPDEPLIGRADFDYADSFEIALRQPDLRSPEQLFRVALTQARWVRMLVPVVHRYVLGFRLGPMSSPSHVLGWKIMVSKADVVQLEAVSPLARGLIVGRKAGTTAVFTTYLFYKRPAAARIILAVISPVHRAVAPYLMECAADTTTPGLSGEMLR